jgi:aspartyl-tRNA(Asn)/glutamyl-tRNA(Gln) amidotransferase subunit C
VAPMANAAAASLPMRDDAVTDGGCGEAILGNAPQAARGFFTVPKVVE